MPHFELLPEDVLRLVLVLSTPATIRQCQRVCRFLSRIIESDTYIQYLLELDTCSYVEPINPRLDLSYSEKREVIRRHRSRWCHPESVSPDLYKLHIGGDDFLWIYLGGVYVRGVQIPGSMYIATRKLYFYQLPSHNRGMEYKHWIISDLGVDTQNFTIDPEQDLLVLAEASDAAQEPQFLNLHLRSMSNNEVHPKTSHGCSVLVYHPLSRLVPARLLLNLEVFGHLLAVAFHSRGRYIPSYVVVWNWTTGTELLRVQTTGDHASFTLLSENLLVLSRSLERYFTTTDVPGEFGFLDVYQFDPQTATSTASTPVASFALPVLKEQEFVATIYLRCGPTTGASNFVSSPSRSPKVFDLAPHSRLLCLNVNISRDPRISSRIFPRTLCIPSCLLLDILANYQAHHSNPLVVPWVEWAEKTSWVDTGALRIRIERSQLGQRIAGFDWGSVFGPELLILDFNQHRVNQTMLEEQAVWEVCTPGTKAPAGDTLKQIGEAVFCGREDLARRKYNKTKFWVGESADVTDAVMIDDEHVIIETVRYIPWLSRILLC